MSLPSCLLSVFLSRRWVLQLVVVLKPVDSTVPEQIIAVPKISLPSRPLRAALAATQMVEQLVEVPTDMVVLMDTEEEEECRAWIDDNDAWVLIRLAGRRLLLVEYPTGPLPVVPPVVAIAGPRRIQILAAVGGTRNAWFDSGHILCVSLRMAFMNECHTIST